MNKYKTINRLDECDEKEIRELLVGRKVKVDGDNRRNNMAKICENCINCMYLEHGDMYCDEHDDFALMYEEFVPTEDYMWCNGKKFERR